MFLEGWGASSRHWARVQPLTGPDLYPAGLAGLWAGLDRMCFDLRQFAGFVRPGGGQAAWQPFPGCLAGSPLPDLPAMFAGWRPWYCDLEKDGPQR